MSTHVTRTMAFHVLILAFALFGCSSPTSGTQSNRNFQVVDGVAIYLGLMPAQLVQGHPTSHPEATMHGGGASADRSDHIVVALFDDATGERNENARVEATVTEIGRGTERKVLEPMKIADTISYGNYFKIPVMDEYLIQLAIDVPNRNSQIQARFQYVYGGK